MFTGEQFILAAEDREFALMGVTGETVTIGCETVEVGGTVFKDALVSVTSKLLMTGALEALISSS